MRRTVFAYLGACLVMLALDAVWLGWLGASLYEREIGSLLLATPRWDAAVIFYLLYIAGIVVLCVRPGLTSGSARHAAALGAFFGVVAYGTYDLTNLATLKGWSTTVVVVDMLWGAFITAAAAAGGTAAARRFGER